VCLRGINIIIALVVVLVLFVLADDEITSVLHVGAPHAPPSSLYSIDYSDDSKKTTVSYNVNVQALEDSPRVYTIVQEQHRTAIIYRSRAPPTAIDKLIQVAHCENGWFCSFDAHLPSQESSTLTDMTGDPITTTLLMHLLLHLRWCT